MEDTQKTYPHQLEFGIWMYGRSFPVWEYDHLPSGMKRVTSIYELRFGRPFLFESRLVPGKFLTSYMRDSILKTVKNMLKDNVAIYVKSQDQDTL